MIPVREPRWTVEQDGCRLSFIVSAQDARQICEMFRDGSQYDMDIKKHRKKRSKNANDLLWEMCTRISDRLSASGDATNSIDVYRSYIRAAGVFDDVTVKERAAEKMAETWQKNGIGWVADKVDYAEDDCIRLRLYYGSSTYNTAEMSRLLNMVIQDAQALGIDTLSASDRALLAQYPDGQ